jgi:hypothetical protein
MLDMIHRLNEEAGGSRAHYLDFDKLNELGKFSEAPPDGWHPILEDRLHFACMWYLNNEAVGHNLRSEYGRDPLSFKGTRFVHHPYGDQLTLVREVNTYTFLV